MKRPQTLLKEPSRTEAQKQAIPAQAISNSGGVRAARQR